MPIEDRRGWKDTVSKSTRMSHPGAEDSDPPPSMSDRSVISLLTKRLGPWVAIMTALCSTVVALAAWFFSAGAKSADIPTKAQLDAVAAADMAVHKTTDDHIAHIDISIAEINATLKFFQQTMQAQQTEIKELRNKNGMRINSRGTDGP